MHPTGIVRDPSYIKHDMGSYHPESPKRLMVLYSLLDEISGALGLKEIAARPASRHELSVIHAARYIEMIESTAGQGHTYLDPDTSACSDTWDAASKAVGALLTLVDAVVAGTIRNGFAFVRPPGHHAEHDRAMGFCFFNNVALAAAYALEHHGMERIAIVDWDLHHGNGTQNAFYEDPRVLFISLHQYPHYPGTGSVRETGHGKGEGYTINVPLGPGAGDAEYLYLFHSIVAPAVEAYRPELMLVSAGFDTHRSDPLGGMTVTEKGYQQMLQVLMHLANELCSDRLILTLEGGYHLNGLREASAVVLETLSQYDPAQEKVPPAPALDQLHPRTVKAIREVLSVQKNYWNVMGG